MYELNELLLSGSDYEIGFLHGDVYKKEIISFLKDDFCRINKIRFKAIEKETIFSYVKDSIKLIEKYLPSISQEIRGLSEGARIKYEEASLIQMRRELSSIYENSLTQGDCTTVCVKTNEGILLGQTIDLSGDVASFGAVHRIHQKNLPEILMYTFSGTLGYMGMNSAGISICINLVMSKEWGVGIPPYIIIREILKYSNIEDCIKVIKNLPKSSSRAFTISDGINLISIEFTPKKLSVIKPELPFCHTNHFIHPNMQTQEYLNPIYLNSSKRRQELIKNMLLKYNNINVENLFQIFSDKTMYPFGICTFSLNNIRNVETVATVVMNPLKGYFYAIKGIPINKIPQRFRISI